MLAYRAIDIQRRKEVKTGETPGAETKLSHTLLEKLVKVFKTHRNAADSDSKWIGDVVGTMQHPIDLD